MQLTILYYMDLYKPYIPSPCNQNISLFSCSEKYYHQKYDISLNFRKVVQLYLLSSTKCNYLHYWRNCLNYINTIFWMKIFLFWLSFFNLFCNLTNNINWIIHGTEILEIFWTKTRIFNGNSLKQKEEISFSWS